MKKILMATAMVAVSAASANAYVGLNLDFNEPAPVYAQPVYAQPAYVEPAPVVVERPVYGHPGGWERHRGYDDRYWRGRR